MSESVRMTLDVVHALATETILANGDSPQQTRTVDSQSGPSTFLDRWPGR